MSGLKGRRNYRKRRGSSSDEDDEGSNVGKILEETMEAQKFRQRTKGVTAAGLAFGKELEPAEQVVHDPFKLKTGGLIDMSGVKDRNRDRTGEDSDKDVTNLGSNFSIETNRRDEDIEMLKYIEEQLEKKKGTRTRAGEDTKKPLTKEDLLYQVPEKINVSSKAMKSEEMLSNQMLSGIPEIDLGVEAKIKNIEATEEAKLRLIDESKKKKTIASDFVPMNMAVNFMHHSRFFDEKKALEAEKKKEKAKKEAEAVEKPKGPVVEADILDTTSDSKTLLPGQNRRKREANSNQSSDDFLFENFRKKTRDSWRYL